MFLKKYESQLYAVMRIVIGFLFFWHGSQKLLGIPSIGQLPWHIKYIAGTIELIGGMFICLGLLTHWAAFIASGEMAYAYWTVHGNTAILPLVNHGELAVFYCFVFLYIAARGSGIWSVDNIFKEKMRTSPE